MESTKRDRSGPRRVLVAQNVMLYLERIREDSLELEKRVIEQYQPLTKRIRKSVDLAMDLLVKGEEEK